MDIIRFLQNNILILDGGMGTLLQEKGVLGTGHPELLNLDCPQVIQQIHKEYFDAGSNLVCTNTFGANSLKFDDLTLEEIIKAAVENARQAQKSSVNHGPTFVALDIGPTGRLLKPYGDLDFEEAVSVFAKTVRLGVKYGVDLAVIETMNDSYETKAALLAVKENSDLPVIVTNAYGADGNLLTGATPEAMVAMLEGMGADCVGANCSLGPKQLSHVAKRLLECASVPVIIKPNAGMPVVSNGVTRYDITADQFASELKALVQEGVGGVGGCCGTTPEYIKLLANGIKGVLPKKTAKDTRTVVSSYTKAVYFGKEPLLIGERINPTGKKRFKQALVEEDMDYILSEGISQKEKGVDLLDVNVGLPEIDEPRLLQEAVCALQSVTDLPLQIDTADAVAMEKALRRYNGKAMVNSVNGKKESMESVFPLVKKYGGAVVALTLDENGIPETVQGRIDIAKNILKTAEEYGINKKDIVFDPLALSVSADIHAPRITLETVRRIKEELGCNTVLGVSNISFGLPNRDGVNSVFFGMALENGLSAAIMNPYSESMMNTYYAFRVLKGMDESCSDYISFAETIFPSSDTPVAVKGETPLSEAIIKGLKDKAASLTVQLLKTVSPMEIINGEIIPALNKVGEGFEKNTLFLPQLLMSAEAAKCAFEQIKRAVPSESSSAKGTFVLATVQGDIHDIGKNIVKLLLENYGFYVVDLGKDVAPRVIVEAVEKHKASLVGLSALMTTTVPAMEKTVKLIKERCPWCRTVVGGAVLTEEYANSMGADKYARDAMETVRYGESVISENI